MGARWLIFWVIQVLDYTYIIFIGFRQLCFSTSFLDNLFSLYTVINIIRVRSRILVGSEVELLMILVNSRWNSILDLARLLDQLASVYYNYTLGENSITSFCSDYIIIIYLYALFYMFLFLASYELILIIFL